MTPLIRIKFPEIKEYLMSQYCFPSTAKIGRRTITYKHVRILPSQSPQITVYVKVMRKTKYVMSCTIGDETYTDLESLKEKIEYRTPSKNHYDKDKKPHKVIYKGQK